MIKDSPALTVHFDPLLPLSWLAVLGGFALCLLLLSAFKNRSGIILRILCVLAFALVILNPSLLQEDRKPVKDVAVIIADRSPSQSMGARTQRTDAALSYLKSRLENRDDLDLRIIEAPQNGALQNKTELFSALDHALEDVPEKRRAGVIFLSDGQIHDIPGDPGTAARYGPLHLLLTGEHKEKDRQLLILSAPAYGIVGKDVTLKYKIEDTDNIGAKTANVTIDFHDGAPQSFIVPPGTEQEIKLPITHAGENAFEISVGAVQDELTESNNKSAVIVNGVRDRLRVLLISGQPYAGARTWRDLLTSDPGVDLVHFTILREPEKLDRTPQNELSLIAFPFRELFEVKLYDFDLIIFDRYQLNRILPDHYFANIVRYVEEGGALLVAGGPDFAGPNSIYYTELQNILPAAPMDEVIRQPFQPKITQSGLQHPVMQNLPDPDAWGPWLREAVIKPTSGDILMTGAQDQPLLILDRVKDGRVAQLGSDQIWLWQRGYKGGGPHAELLRRVIHWLMKEPELDEKALDVIVNSGQITVRSHKYKQDNLDILMHRPDGSEDLIHLSEDKNGDLSAVIDADQLGIWSFEAPDGQKRFAVVGDLNPPELRGVIATDKPLSPMIQDSNGGAIWLEDTPHPEIRILHDAHRYAGHGWIALRANHDYTVEKISGRPLLPPGILLVILLGLVTLTWWRESRSI